MGGRSKGYDHARVAEQRGIIDQVAAKLLPEKKKDDTILCRPGRISGRQPGRQSAFSDRFYEWSIGGAADATLFQI